MSVLPDSFGSPYREDLEEAYEKLKIIFENQGVDEAHGIGHAKAVLLHAIEACKCDKMPKHTEFLILISALLHDADCVEEKKLKTTNYPNVRSIVGYLGPQYESYIVARIAMVSCSKNKDSPIANRRDEYPRHCDRLEAIGEVGIARAYIYTKHIGQPLYLPDTPRVTNHQELDLVATKERYANYNGKSRSMMDHYYDKLVHLTNIQSSNEYISREVERRRKVVFDFVFAFGRTGTLDIAYLDSLAEKYK